MITILSSPSTWLHRLPLLCGRYFVGQSRSVWKQSLICEGREMKEDGKPCYPKDNACPTGTGKCPLVSWPNCTEPNIKPPSKLSCCCTDNLSKDPCDTSSRKKVQPKRRETPFRSMWGSMEIDRPCPNTYHRYDDTHYKSSDKVERLYTQTWKTCEPVIRKRRACCLDGMCMFPPLEKRRKEERPRTAEEKDSDKLKVDYKALKNCLQNVTQNPSTRSANKCRKIVMPKCRTVAKSIKCHVQRSQSKCVKYCCPHPSFSECNYPPTKRGPSEECLCSTLITNCEVGRFLVRKKLFNLPPPLPFWPPKERPK